MMIPQPPRSKLAVAFYVAGALSLLANAFPALLLGGMAASGSRGLGSMFGPLGFALLIQPVSIILFGGVVQILSDIRWVLLDGRSKSDA